MDSFQSLLTLLLLMIVLLMVDLTQQTNSVKFIDCSGALVQTVQIDQCDQNDTSICKIWTVVDQYRDIKPSIDYHVDFIANQNSDKIRLEIALKSPDDAHDDDLLLTFDGRPILFDFDDDFETIAEIENLCEGNKDVCPTKCHTLYHVKYSLDLGDHSQFLYNQEIKLQNKLYNKVNNKLLACFRHSIMLVYEPESYDVPKALPINAAAAAAAAATPDAATTAPPIGQNRTR